MDQMETAQRDFLDAHRRWNADKKGDFRLLEICSDAEQRLLATPSMALDFGYFVLGRPSGKFGPNSINTRVFSGLKPKTHPTSVLPVAREESQRFSVADFPEEDFWTTSLCLAEIMPFEMRRPLGRSTPLLAVRCGTWGRALLLSR
jgi:hypothetical protein